MPDAIKHQVVVRSRHPRGFWSARVFWTHERTEAEVGPDQLAELLEDRKKGFIEIVGDDIEDFAADDGNAHHAVVAAKRELEGVMRDRDDAREECKQLREAYSVERTRSEELAQKNAELLARVFELEAALAVEGDAKPKKKG